MWTLQHVNRGRCRLQQLHNSCYFCMLGKLVMEGQVSAADTSFPCIWHCLEAFCGPKPKAYKAVKRKITLWVGYLWDSPSGRGAQRNMSWNDKGIRLCFPRLTPSSSVCGPRSLMESPAALKVQWWSFQCGVSSRRRVCVLCACVLPPQQDLQLALALSLHAQPSLLSCCGTILTSHMASWPPGSLFQYPSQQQAHPGGMPPTQHLPPISHWQPWQHSWETLLLTHVAKRTLGMTAVWLCYLWILLLTAQDLRGCCLKSQEAPDIKGSGLHRDDVGSSPELTWIKPSTCWMPLSWWISAHSN